MRIVCTHGYFRFYESKAGEISDFMSLYGFALVPKDNYFTFAFLLDAPEFSIKGAPYLGVAALETFEGKPWEVFRENGLAYDFTKNLVVPILSVTKVIQVDTGLRYFLSPGLILPGSVKDDGLRVTDYSAWYLFSSMKFRYSEITYE